MIGLRSEVCDVIALRGENGSVNGLRGEIC